ncbi:hypothetical protein [Arenibacter sp. F20364]|uniref:hypothetical protein n=1 Tax=Arenibacter sp. F20364 TaxID=2926415 RepID=UPI001FF2B171|nr:hypothetical protein [Arenibacter sp. F20364]MCK0191904.1 hypothetical protein [Arenibacter sp. F20364]
MNNLFKLKVQSYFVDQSILTKNQLVELIKNDHPKMKYSTIMTYISLLKSQGVLDNPSRGMYTLKHKD